MQIVEREPSSRGSNAIIAIHRRTENARRLLEEREREENEKKKYINLPREILSFERGKNTRRENRSYAIGIILRSTRAQPFVK